MLVLSAQPRCVACCKFDGPRTHAAREVQHRAMLDTICPCVSLAKAEQEQLTPLTESTAAPSTPPSALAWVMDAGRRIVSGTDPALEPMWELMAFVITADGLEVMRAHLTHDAELWRPTLSNPCISRRCLRHTRCVSRLPPPRQKMRGLPPSGRLVPRLPTTRALTRRLLIRTARRLPDSS